MGMNKKQHDYYYPKICVKQHGEFCKGCGVYPHPSVARCMPELPILISKLKIFWLTTKEGKWIIPHIDHIDGDDNNNDLENLQLLCPSCNNLKKQIKRTILSTREKSPEMVRGDLQEDQYRSWLNTQCTVEGDFITDDEAINGGAEHLTDFSDGKTISPVTTRRYLKKLTSIVGWYYWYKGFVGLKINLPKLDAYLTEVERRKGKKIKKIQEFHEAYIKDFNKE